MRVARSHLHMVLPHLLALSYGNRFSTLETSVTANPLQLQAAHHLVELLHAEDPKAARIIDSTRLLVDFYLQVNSRFETGTMR